MFLFKKKQKNNGETILLKEKYNEYEEDTVLLTEKTEESEYETTLLEEYEEDEYEGQTTLLTEEEYEEEYEGQTSLLSEEYSPYLHPESNQRVNDLTESNSDISREHDVEGVTTLLSSENTYVPQGIYIPNNAPRAYLMKIIKSERVYINKIKFVVGSCGEADYIIDNETVSRKHAFIIYNNEKYYLVDNKSTNKTLLDGNMLEVQTPVELYHGALIQFSDEMFQFIYE